MVCQSGSHRAVYPSDAGTPDAAYPLRDGEVFRPDGFRAHKQPGRLLLVLGFGWRRLSDPIPATSDESNS